MDTRSILGRVVGWVPLSPATLVVIILWAVVFGESYTIIYRRFLRVDTWMLEVWT